MRLVSIHQPNFLPWMGYFSKIVESDSFVFLDNVQLTKKGGSWSNRSKIMVNGIDAWITAPLKRPPHGTVCINQARLNSDIPWQRKITRAIELNYYRSPFFDDIFPVVAEIFSNQSVMLSDFNISAVRRIMKLIHIDTSKLVLGSSLSAKGHATDLLISIVKEVGGDAYLCGGGADGYQDDELFAKSNVTLRYQNFTHPQYPQFNAKTFVSGLSIIDPLMNCGPERTRELIERKQ